MKTSKPTTSSSQPKQSNITTKLREELRKAGFRWSKMYESLNQTQRVQLYDKLVADRRSKEQLEEEYRKRRAQPEPEDNMEPRNSRHQQLNMTTKTQLIQIRETSYVEPTIPEHRCENCVHATGRYFNAVRMTCKAIIVRGKPVNKLVHIYGHCNLHKLKELKQFG